ncbi:SAV_915 family protein [Prauserella halophila]|uniref:SAV_915 family protein n=1 Tax=Prauserella halophila TaxID=185641 RepID=UPI0020A3F9B0|nr:SAV_915 family protein [Prauserella halophila]MCP2236824.1 SseB protein N-terminal domain [Prauserella halophila]
MPEERFGAQDALAPPVIGPEFADAADDRPDEVYLPSERVHYGDEEATVELRRLEDERLVLLAFTSLEALVEGCGEGQPWLSVRSDYLNRIVTDSGATEVLWNAVLPDDQRQEAVPTGGVREWIRRGYRFAGRDRVETAQRREFAGTGRGAASACAERG